MKKFFAVVLVTWCLAASVAFAIGYPRFWKGDKNYPFVWGHQGTAWYLDKNSVTVKLNAPPYYIVTAKTISVRHSDYSPGEEKYSNDKEAGSTVDYEFFYDDDESDMRERRSAISDGNWTYLSPQNAGSTVLARGIEIGEAVFYVATGRKFYGNYLWIAADDLGEVYKDEHGNNEYWDIFKDNFYTDLR